LNTTSYNANETEKIKISKVKYIVSNIRLEDKNGSVFTYPKNESYFIVNEENTDSQFINLKNVPAGDYTKITFGIGIDQEVMSWGKMLAQARDKSSAWWLAIFPGIMIFSCVMAFNIIGDRIRQLARLNE
jgi:hypothetical protein